uniref:Uncharacterized protein n=1 Tax=Amphiprion percula TaxID=161767 RepID=A0A3P8TFC2_AMPPE
MEHFYILKGVVGCHGEVYVSRGEEVKHTGLKVQILYWESLFALGLCRLVGETVRPGAAPGPACAVGLRRSSSEVPKIDALVVHDFLRNLLHHAQGVCSVSIPSVLGAICKCSRQLVCLCVVRLLLHTFLEVLKDDCSLSGRNKVGFEQKKQTGGNHVI